MSTFEFNPYFTGNATYRLFNETYKHLNGTYVLLNEPDEPEDKTPISKVGDFSPFYTAIAICTVILGCIIILNIICCCSRYSDYWLDRHTGNRWLVSIWSATPHKQPPLDFTELESNYQQVHYVQHFNDNTEDYPESHKQNIPPSFSQQPLTSSQEYLELHKRESDI